MVDGEGTRGMVQEATWKCSIFLGGGGSEFRYNNGNFKK